VAREAVLWELVVVACLRDIDVPSRCSRDGSSRLPAATLTVSFAGASQNRLDPHSAQKPRRASLSLSGLAIQRNALL
jgi:hypothetical protein